MSRKLLPKYLESDDVERLMQATEQGYNIKRNKAIIWMLYTTGLRVSELASLNIQDIVRDGQVVDKFIIKGKGNSERMIYLKPDTREFIRKYVGMDLQKQRPLFTHSDDKRLTTTAIWKIVKQTGERAGINKKVTPHILRHSYAVHLLKNDVPIRMIQDLLGHESLNTTMIYTKVNNRDLEDRLNQIDF